MQNRPRKLATVVVVVCSTIAVWLGWLTVKIWSMPLPKPVAIQIALPEAEILPASAVHPGTFRIEKTVPELVRLARENPAGRPLVSFSGGWRDRFGAPIQVEY